MILVTGVTGLAGHFVVEELLRRGRPVGALVRPSNKYQPPPGVTVAEGDLADPDSLRAAVRGAAALVHCACATMRPNVDPAVDVDALAVLLDAWDPRAPLVYLSSVDVYGFPKEIPVSEAHPLADDPPLSDYAGGKVRCERALLAWARDRGSTAFSILRPPHIWGPHPVCRARLVEAWGLDQGRPIVLPDGPPGERDRYGDSWVDTRDLAFVTAECLERPLSKPANVVSGDFTWTALLTLLIESTGSASRLTHGPDETATLPKGSRTVFYKQTWRYSPDLLLRRLGWQSRRRWPDTVRETVGGR